MCAYASSLFFNPRERKSEQSERETRGGGGGRRAKLAKRRIEGPHFLPRRVFRFELASIPLSILSVRSTVE